MVRESKGETGSSSSLFAGIGAPAALLLLIVAAFSGAFPEDLPFDARGIIEANPLLQDASPWWAAFSSNYWGELRFDGLYRPLALSALRLGYGPLGFAENAKGYAAINLALHTLVVLLVWRLAIYWLSSRRAAFLAAAIFSIHPLTSAVVPNIVGVSDLLAALFVVAGLLAWEKQIETGRWRWALVTACLWLLGLLSKESAVVLPALALLREGTRDQESKPLESKVRWGARLVAYVPLAAAGALWLSVRLSVLSGRGERFVEALNNPLVLESLPTRVMTALVLTATYLRQTVLPLALSPDYSFHQMAVTRSPLSVEFVGSTLVLFAAVFLVVLCWRRWLPLAAGLAFFFIALLPVSNLFFALGTIRADRLLYLPLIGICLAAGELLDRFGGSVEKRSGPMQARIALVAITGLLLLTGIWLTRRETAVWRTNLSVWEHAVRTTPSNLKAHYNLAWFLQERGPEESERILHHLEQAVVIARRLPGDEYNGAHINLGRAYLLESESHTGDDGSVDAEGRSWLEKALAVLKEARERESYRGRRRAWWEREQARRIQAGQLEGSEKAQFGDVELYVNLATVLDLLGRGDEAIGHWEKASAIAPQRAEIQYQLALANLRAGRFEIAEEALETTTRLDPGNEDAWVRLAAIRLDRGRYREAIDTLSAAMKHHFRSTELKEMLAQVYVAVVELLRRSGKEMEALALVQQAVSRDGFPPSLFEAGTGG